MTESRDMMWAYLEDKQKAIEIPAEFEHLGRFFLPVMSDDPIVYEVPSPEPHHPAVYERVFPTKNVTVVSERIIIEKGEPLAGRNLEIGTASAIAYRRVY